MEMFLKLNRLIMCLFHRLNLQMELHIVVLTFFKATTRLTTQMASMVVLL